MAKLFALFLVLALFFSNTLAAPTRGRKAVLTMYWKADESNFKTASKATLRSCNGSPIATVNGDFAKSVRLEGTGTTKSGKLVNLGDCDCGNGFNCFMELDKSKFPFGISHTGQPLEPFVDIAMNNREVGTTLIITALKGVKLPNGKEHNGCVRVADIGYGFGGDHCDWFVASLENYEILKSNVPANSEIKETPCQLLKY
jgi:hypothetical protein